MRLAGNIAYSGKCANISSHMPITSSAKKAHRASLKKRAYNQRRAKVMKDSVKDVRKLAHDGKAEDAQKSLSAAYKAIDKAAKRGIIKKNAAARKKSRLAAAVNKSRK